MIGFRALAALGATLLALPVAAQPEAPPASPAAPASPPAAEPAPAPDAGPAPEAAPSPVPPPAPPPAPPGYYVEGPASPILEPPLPGAGPIVEPPPPPVARHVAPRTALWAGIRAGWFLPFGSLYARALPPDPDGIVLLEPVPWRDYASSGLVLEADVGARIARNYMVFALWERAQLGGGRTGAYGPQAGADSDYFAAALRATSNPDRVGLLTEIALGYRQARTRFEDGGRLELTGASFEGRLGVGADIRFNPWFTLSPLATIGVGSFGRIRRVLPSGAAYDATGPRDESDSHGWFTLTVGGHVDFFGAK